MCSSDLLEYLARGLVDLDLVGVVDQPSRQILEQLFHRQVIGRPRGISRLQPQQAKIHIRGRVARIRAPATNVPRNVPETLDSPPVRRR